MSLTNYVNVKVSEPHSGNSSVSEPHTQNVNVSEPHTRNVNMSEPHTRLYKGCSHLNTYCERAAALQSRASSEEPSMQDALNKPRMPGRETARVRMLVRPYPLVSVINSATHSAPPPFCLANVYS